MNTSETRGDDNHRQLLAAFQNADERFVWGRDQLTGDLWFLTDGMAHDYRPYVKANVVCPVPGCAAALTTVHSVRKRDHLRHLRGTGGHARESLLHSQGCALIEDWLRRAYPRSVVRREEYTNPGGERRADVMLTGPRGDRVAFEVQYSSLTPDAWQARHDSYRAQDVVDVWLFGHTGKNLRLDSDGLLKPNPTHEAVVASGAALLFINPDPDRREVVIVVGTSRPFNAESESYGLPQPALNCVDGAHLEVHSLDEFRADKRHGIMSSRLHQLYARTALLQEHNRAEHARVGEVRERKRLVRAARQRAWEIRRAPQQGHIRGLLGDKADRWNRSEAVEAIQVYFGEYLRGRIDTVSAPSAPNGWSMTRWQCVVYFDLIAGQAAEFGVPAAVSAITRREVQINEATKWRKVASYLHGLAEAGFLAARQDLGRYPNFSPTISGAWW